MAGSFGQILTSPFPRAKVTSLFGWRWLTRKDGSRYRNYHRGIDFAAPMGTPIRLAASGVLFDKGFDSVIGYWVEILLDDGRRIRYHMLIEPSKVAKGKRLAAGAIVGHVGMSGSSATGPHLHVEILDAPNRVPINPLTAFTFGAFPTGSLSGEIDMATASEIWNTKIRIGGKDVSVLQVIANIAVDTATIRGELEKLPAAVWEVPVQRGGKPIRALQELADANTRLIALAQIIGTGGAGGETVDLDALATLIASRIATPATADEIAQATVEAFGDLFPKA